jgi:hypothetical protein
MMDEAISSLQQITPFSSCVHDSTSLAGKVTGFLETKR